MKRKRNHIFRFLFCGLTLVFLSTCIDPFRETRVAIPQVLPSDELSGETNPTIRKQFSEGTTLSSLLGEAGFNVFEVHRISTAARKLVDLGKIKREAHLDFFFPKYPLCCEAEMIEKITLELERGQSLILRPLREDSSGKPAKLSWVGEIVDLPQESRLVRFSAVLDHASLWKSAAEAGIDAGAMNVFVELFSWDIDFSREIRAGATLSFIVEELLIEGKHFAWSYIRAAEFFTGDRLVQAVRFDGDELNPGGYYRPDGQSLKRMFLKSPIEAARVTSGFSLARFHPIFKVSRPHMGVDYAAPEGTPIRAIGGGVVETASYREGSGNFLRIKHNETYETAYKHLSAFGKDIVPGSRVEQGDVIGFVGSTGWATGPHLHFELYKNGEYIDPLGEVFPGADPLPEEVKGKFKKSAQFWLAQLPKTGASSVLARQ